MLEKEFQYFLDNKDAFVKEYLGKYLIIAGEELQGAFDSELQALKFACTKFRADAYLIQQCLSEEVSRLKFG